MTPSRLPAQQTPVRRYSAYLFDLDGTVYLGDELIPGAADVLARLRGAGSRTIFLSNNPTRDVSMYTAKLRGLGIEVDDDDVVNPVASTIAWLGEHAAGARVFAIAEPPFVAALAAAGVELSEDPAEIDVVIASFDRTFDYRKLQIAFDALWEHGRARLITTNPDRYCPLAGGKGHPDAAGIVAAIEATTGARCEANMGKPDRVMIDVIRARLGADGDDAIMVGDRLATDVRMGANAGIDSALVLTGDSTLDEVALVEPRHRPSYVLESIGGLTAGW